MKKVVTFIALMMGLTFVVKAQDVIVTKQSERIDANIIEVSATEVKYKKQSNPTGPTFTLATSKIASVIYANGEVQTFGKEKSAKEPSDKSLFDFLPEGTSVTRHFGANWSYVLPIGEGSYVFPSTEIAFTYGYTFNDHLYAGLSLGFFDFTEDRKEKTTSDNNAYVDEAYAYVPVQNSMISIPLGIDFRYTFTSWKIQPMVGLRLGFSIPIIPSQLSTGRIEKYTGFSGHYGNTYIYEWNSGYDAYYRETAEAVEHRISGFWGGFSIGAKKNGMAIGVELMAPTIKIEKTRVIKERYYGYPDGEKTTTEEWNSDLFDNLLLNIRLSFDISSKKIK